MSSPVPHPAADRGRATRDRLVAAALKLFGRKGFDGVGAREIAQAAGVPLSAIPYHFGTKEALYRAVVARVTASLAEALDPAVAEARAALDGPPEAAARGLVAFQGALLEVMALSPDSEDWAKLLLREHLDPSSAFDLVYEDAARGAVDLLAALLGRAGRRAPEDPGLVVEAFALMGEVLVFRTVQAAVLRRTGWEAVRAPEVRAAYGRLRGPAAASAREEG